MRFFATLIFAIFVITSAICARGEDTYHLSVWNPRDGSPPDIWAIAQDKNGFLWLGTGAGLYRFDGVHFAPFQQHKNESFLSDDITAVTSLPDGTLWVGYYQGGVCRIKNGYVENFKKTAALIRGEVPAIVQDLDGVVWVASADGLARYANGNWATVGKDWNYPTNAATWVMSDSDGTLWVATGKSLVYLRRGSHQFQDTGVTLGNNATLARDPDGVIWASDWIGGTRALTELSGKRPSGARQRTLSAQAIYADRMFFDADGHLWGSNKRSGGVFLLNSPKNFEDGRPLQTGDVDAVFDAKHGLTSDKAVPIMQDKEGNVWVGTNFGLNGLHRRDVTPLPGARFKVGVPFGLASDGHGGVWAAEDGKIFDVTSGAAKFVMAFALPVFTFFADDDGVLWTQTQDRNFYRIKDGHVSLVTPPLEVRDKRLTAQTSDREHGLWMAFADGSIYHTRNGAWTTLPTSRGTAEVNADTMSVDEKGNLWIGYADGRIRAYGKGDRIFSDAEGLHIGGITAIATSTSMDLSGGELGLAELSGQHFKSISSIGTQEISGVSGIVHLRKDYWLNTNQGVIRISETELKKSFDDADYRPEYKLFDYRDGLPGIALQVNSNSTAFADSNGDIWLLTNQGIGEIDPSRIHFNRTPPEVLILGIDADGKRYIPSVPVELPKRTTNLSIEYTATSLYVPERVRFRYKLAGVDDNWQEAGSRREAFYTNLKPGQYVFRVIAANDDGVWNLDGSSLTFTIAPTFYQTTWFSVLCAVFVALTIVTLFLLRLRQLSERARLRVEERHAERERIARELHDTLMQSMHGLTLQVRCWAEDPSETEVRRAEMAKAACLASEMLIEGRDRILALRSSKTLSGSLAESLRRLESENVREHPCDFTVTVDGKERKLRADTQGEVLAIAREGVHNAFVHAGAKSITVGIAYGRRSFSLNISDDGMGITGDILRNAGKSGHWGIVGMYERASRIEATLSISCASGQGTKLNLVIPTNRAYEKKIKVTGPLLGGSSAGGV